MRSHVPARIAVTLVVYAAAAAAHASCGASFCMVNTNWNMQGFAPEPGLRMDLRLEYIDQDQPRVGRGKVPFGQIRRHHDEIRTINRNYIATLDYTMHDGWSVAATVPVVDRSHDHVHNHLGARLREHWSFAEAGDVQVLARRQWVSENEGAQTLSFYGVTFGVKLPTGEFDRRNRTGALAERSLQPGSGTTDVMLGGFFSHVVPAANISWFAQAQVQVPTGFREHYKPGKRVTSDIGVRYEVTDGFGLMLQVNGLFRTRDRGRDAEPADTGGTFVFVSPGVSYAILPKTQVYAFVQKPVYQYVNGIQITPDWALLLGVTSRF
ncbi:MAG TPA: transporter [Burkholderiales bacterium]|nr:transporter [Burkholderiales bacterium]